MYAINCHDQYEGMFFHIQSFVIVLKVFWFLVSLLNRQHTKQLYSIVGTAGSGLSTVDPYPKKLRDTVNGRLKSDAIICTAIFVLTTLLHWSGFFARLQPNLNYVLWIMTGILGFSQHYVLPQLRKQLPWLCFSHPILKSREYGQFEVGCLVFIISRFLELRFKYNEIFFSC